MFDLSNMDVGERVMRDVSRRIHDRNMLKCQAAIAKQRLAASAGGTRTIKDGTIKFAVSPEFYHYWGQRLGYACWEDKTFIREFLRDNPECRVQSKTGNIQVGSMGTENGIRKTEENRVKFRKVYREEDYKKK